MKELLKKFRKLEKKDKTIFFLLCTASINLLVSGIKFILAFSLPSLWFTMNASFSGILACSRFITIKEYKKIRLLNDEGLIKRIEYRNYLKNGVMLIFLGVMYFFISSYMYFNGTNTTMHEYITYLVALIAFWSIGTAIYGMIKYKKNEEPIIKAVKLTNFSNALTSIVLTQVVLLDTFSTGYDSRINGYTGMGVSLVIIIIGLYMIFGIQKYLEKGH